jgi:hypothetical protein
MGQVTRDSRSKSAVAKSYRMGKMLWAFAGLIGVMFSPPALAQSTVPPPSGFGGNHNYILSNDCKPVTDISVTIRATQTIVGPKGLGVQLNANSPPPPPGAAPKDTPAGWQQYMMGIGYRPAFNWVIQNWGSSGILYQEGDPYLVPMRNVIWPAGYTLTIALRNDPKGNITGAEFVVADDRGHVLKRASKMLQDFHGFSKVYLAPINAFQLNLVGPTGGEVLSSGEGTITYAASTPMTVANHFPKTADNQFCVTRLFTAEKANTIYGELPAGPAKTFTQTFSVMP